MWALDTNVLVRYIAQDDPSQSAAATRFIEEAISPTEPAFVSLVALLETVWVLESRYAAKPSLVCEVLDDLLSAAAFQLQEAAAVRRAVSLYKRGRVDLHDALIVSMAAERGATAVTFDEKAARRLGMRLLK